MRPHRRRFVDIWQRHPRVPRRRGGCSRATPEVWSANPPRAGAPPPRPKSRYRRRTPDGCRGVGPPASPVRNSSRALPAGTSFAVWRAMPAHPERNDSVRSPSRIEDCPPQRASDSARSRGPEPPGGPTRTASSRSRPRREEGRATTVNEPRLRTWTGNAGSILFHGKRAPP
jgi:hypothetical protein